MSPTSSSLSVGKPAFWVSAVILACGMVLAIDPLPFRSPVAPPEPVPAWATDTTPVRRPGRQPDYQVAVYTYRCNDCHAIIPKYAAQRDGGAIQHTEIQLEHGINTRCLNCHHETNRNAFAGDGGAEIAWDQPQLLCAKCHGPVYRDWQHGSHGRTNGYWNTARGNRTRLRCIECHDPHRPPFVHLRPAPPPRTLRMGPAGAREHDAPRDPLQLDFDAHPPANEDSWSEVR
jgi:hypothetical protein